MEHLEDSARALVDEVLRTGLMLIDVLSSLLEDLPDDAFPGEDPAEVLLEMVAGSVRPAVDAAGPVAVEHARALVGAVADRVISDLRLAVEIGSRSPS